MIEVYNRDLDRFQSDIDYRCDSRGKGGYAVTAAVAVKSDTAKEGNAVMVIMTGYDIDVKYGDNGN